ncbi:hypothetical protein EYM_01725 [Ignicoccus islandicus DSM 13165]|uniref:Uncharacterized protein n=1 Tax=Ignicoccus islandicus DSM 13165 TaxID=940295 RepID=A0A0U2MAI9_9CREN|nr:hypothetical protein [Ignicoccus islandicus]ALU12237.1 hypothetical protein EYM_01725 [Ignicoccus islandicus DSM 13165]
MFCSLVLLLHNVTSHGITLQYLWFQNNTVALSLTLPNPCYKVTVSNSTISVERYGFACIQVLRRDEIFLTVKGNATFTLNYLNDSIQFGKAYRFCANNSVKLIDILNYTSKFVNKMLELKLLCLGYSIPVNLPGPPFKAPPVTKCDSVVTDGSAWIYVRGPLCTRPIEVLVKAKVRIAKVPSGMVPYLEVIDVLGRWPR